MSIHISQPKAPGLTQRRRLIHTCCEQMTELNFQVQVRQTFSYLFQKTKVKEGKWHHSLKKMKRFLWEANVLSIIIKA